MVEIATMQEEIEIMIAEILVINMKFIILEKELDTE
jgi:hypothetical protein